MYRGSSASGSVSEKIFKSIKVDQKNEIVTVNMDTTKETLQEFYKELLLSIKAINAMNDQQSMAAGKEAIVQVSGNIVVVAIIGNTNPEMTSITSINIKVTAATGAGKLNLKKIIVRVANDKDEEYMDYSPKEVYDTYFTATEIRDPSGLFTAEDPTFDSSSLVQLNVPILPRISLQPSTQYHIELIPERGAPTVIDGITPSAYSTHIQQLYP